MCCIAILLWCDFSHILQFLFLYNLQCHIFDNNASSQKGFLKGEALCLLRTKNVLRAIRACTFSSLIWPAGSAPAALASLLFYSPEPQIIGKTQCLATFLPFRAPASSPLLTFSISYLLPSDFLPVRVSSWLCFFLAVLFICPYCRIFSF